MAQKIQNEKVAHPPNETEEVDLNSFSTNVSLVEAWLLKADEILGQERPDPKKIRIHSQDLTIVLAEATRQAAKELNSPLSQRYFSLIDKLSQYIARSERVLKRDQEQATDEMNAAAGSPPRVPVDNGPGSADDGSMEARVAKLESDLTAIKIDVAVIKANGATKSDVAEAKSAIIMWVAAIVFLAQCVPAVIKFIDKYV